MGAVPQMLTSPLPHKGERPSSRAMLGEVASEAKREGASLQTQNMRQDPLPALPRKREREKRHDP
jgi:hypothetical protein